MFPHSLKLLKQPGLLLDGGKCALDRRSAIMLVMTKEPDSFNLKLHVLGVGIIQNTNFSPEMALQNGCGGEQEGRIVEAVLHLAGLSGFLIPGL